MTTATSTLSPASLALREVAATDPQRTMLEIDGRAVSYGELNAQADRLAARLLELVGEESAQVAVRTFGTHELAVGFLAVQRAGMVGVPIDPTAPEERIRMLLADVSAALLISDVDGDAELGLDVPVIAALAPTDTPHAQADSPPEPIDRERGELASIVYTSGSTGTPKGVMLAREQMNKIYSHLRAAGVRQNSRVGAIAAGTVGPAEMLIGSALTLQDTLVVYEIRRHLLAPLADWLETSRIEAFYIIPTVLRFLVPTLEPDRHFSGIKQVFFAAEPSTWEDVAAVRRHMDDDVIVANMFGQSETVSLTWFQVAPEMEIQSGPLPSGVPMPGVELLIVDERGEPVAPGEPGEIIVHSETVALGYWRRPDLSATTFRDLPDGRREVRTGDAGRIGPDGVLHHLGRLDHVVKIYGNRVELGEIEAEVAQIDGVQAAVAAAYTAEDGQTRVIAAVVRTEGSRLDSRLLRTALARRLPGYMVPARIAFVEQLPQLSNGKVDRLTIAELPDSDAAGTIAEAPEGELETQLAAIWAEVLGRDGVGRHDDFFAIGGDSLKAGEMFVEIESRLGIDQPVSLMAEARTIASLAQMLSVADNWQVPVPFQTEGERPPLFVIHDGSGSLLFARTLVEHRPRAARLRPALRGIRRPAAARA